MQNIGTYFGEKQQAQNYIPWKEILNNTLFFLMILISIITVYTKKLKKYRFIHLTLIVIIMGFLTKEMLSSGFFYNIIISGIP